MDGHAAVAAEAVQHPVQAAGGGHNHKEAAETDWSATRAMRLAMASLDKAQRRRAREDASPEGLSRTRMHYWGGITLSSKIMGTVGITQIEQRTWSWM